MATGAASVTLTQTKLAAAQAFAVRSVVTLPNPVLLALPLLISASPAGESFLRTASLAELQGGTWLPNPLDVFADTVIDVTTGSPIAGDTLRILAAPFSWDDALPPYVDFIVASAGVGSLSINGVFPAFNIALSWQLLRVGAVYASGTSGYTVRANGALTEFVDSQFTSLFTDPLTALQYMTALTAQMTSLVNAASFDPNIFRNAPPGNPVIDQLVGSA